jgi:PAS domain S-box-containing protein
MIGTDLLEALPVAVYTTDAEGCITYYNQSAADLWGCRPEIGSDRWCGSWRLYWPDGRPLPHDECPMAVSLKEGRPVRGIEAIAERPDGTRVRFLPYPTPLHDSSGRLTGAINLLVDVTGQYEADAVAAHLAAIVGSSDDAIVGKTLDGKITSWNDGATRIFGYEANEMIGQHITRIIPVELHAEEKRILTRLQRGERVDHYETVRVAKDGRRIDISLTVSPLCDKFGNVIGASKVARDITERKQAERLQRLLIDELGHRVKNTLAVIQAIASQSLRHAKSPTDFVSGFTGRVQALARADNLLTQTKLQGAELAELLQEQVLLGGVHDNRIICSGPTLLLDAQAAVHMALVLHELATNARKYGALSVPEGRLSVNWEMRTDAQPTLFLEWKESNGPRVNDPKKRGFGSTLIERTLRGHGGQTSVRYGTDGVTCQITLPLPEQSRPNLAIHAAALKKDAMVLPQSPNDEPRLKSKRIIIIEDEPLVSMELESTLTDAGLEVAGSAGTLEQAEALVSEADCDAALLDANLAGHPVDDLAAMLTQRNVPYAFMTGYGREALPHGLRDGLMLKKPFSQEKLLAVVELLVYQTPGVVQLRRKEV